VAAGAVALSTLAFAPVASANYAPQLPNRIETGERTELKVENAQPGCRVTFSIRRVGVSGQRGLVRNTRTAVDPSGEAESSLQMPTRPGRYLLITRTDNFPGQTGCTPTRVDQIITVR
jgi:hypothetical protein